MRIEWKWSILSRFSSQLGLAKLHEIELSLKVESKMSFFSERQSYLEEKNYSLFPLSLGASYMQKTGEFEFSSLAEEISFCLIFVGICC